jgi:mannose-6-phosphate isomerase-like protein (cupin superfamily)
VVRRERINTDTKGWFAGPWDSDLSVSVGFANQGVDDPHVHSVITEIYLVARGTSVARVGSETIDLKAGDALIVEPGEAHTFLSSSSDYLHFVVHSPGLTGDSAQGEKQPVPRSRLGL